MKSISTRLNKFLQSLKDKDSRDAFVAARVATAVALRIFNLRKKKGWSQEELARTADMKQARISVLERADYENFSFSTLRRIAAAFGVAVIVDFVSFPDFLRWSDSFSSESVVPESFDESTSAVAVIRDIETLWPTLQGESAQRGEQGFLHDQTKIPLSELTEVLWINAPATMAGGRIHRTRLPGHLLQ